MRLLLIEDDRKVASFIVKGLTESGYVVDPVHDGVKGLEAAEAEVYDLVIIDWMLPGMNGLDVCRRIRAFAPHLPILFLTARESVPDRVSGLEAGADDYLCKPFAFLELLARIRALLRRGSRMAEELRTGDLLMNVHERKVTRGGRIVDLSNKEFAVLEYLLRNKNRLVTRATLTEHVWNVDFDRGTNLIDVYINYLRKKLDDRKDSPMIRTVRGGGYMLVEENA